MFFFTWKCERSFVQAYAISALKLARAILLSAAGFPKIVKMYRLVVTNGHLSLKGNLWVLVEDFPGAEKWLQRTVRVNKRPHNQQQGHI